MKKKLNSKPKLTQNLSSSTLFYFTNKLDWIIDTIKNGFLCRFHFEKFPIVRSGYVSPMKCFCDTPLSLIKPHLSWYGNYGIGIDKQYGRKLGITPVFYIHRKSSFIISFRHSILDKSIEQDPLLTFYKRYYGDIIKNKKVKRRRFYDEREWRYIPSSHMPFFFYSYDDGDIDKKLKHFNNKLKIRLTFDLKALEYIIVDTPKDLEKLLPVLKSVSAKKGITYESLVSKILTARQIRRDF